MIGSRLSVRPSTVGFKPLCVAQPLRRATVLGGGRKQSTVQIPKAASAIELETTPADPFKRHPVSKLVAVDERLRGVLVHRDNLRASTTQSSS